MGGVYGNMTVDNNEHWTHTHTHTHTSALLFSSLLPSHLVGHRLGKHEGVKVRKDRVGAPAQQLIH